MAVLGVDDFKSKLRGGGARPNLFQVTINYPGFADGDPELTSFLCATTIINDTDFSIRNSIERWMNGINAHSANTGLTAPITYEADLLVDQLDRNGDKLKTYTFRGAYPQDLSEIAVSYADNDNIERFTCTWAYQYFESNTTS